MGSRVHAQALKAAGAPVQAMLSLETMGYYADTPGSQKYPWPLNRLYPSQGDFIAFVASTGDLGLVRAAVRSFRQHAAFPSEGIAAPRFIPGVDQGLLTLFSGIALPGLGAGSKAHARSKVGTLQARATPQTAPRPGNPKGRPLPARHPSLCAWRVQGHTRRRPPRLTRRQGPSRPRKQC